MKTLFFSFQVCVKQKFCPIEEHRHWCPWIGDPETSNSTAQSCSSPSQKSSTPPYVTAIKTIAPGLIDNNTGLAQAMKTVSFCDDIFLLLNLSF